MNRKMTMPSKNKGDVSRTSTRINKHNYYFGDNAIEKHRNQLNRSRQVIKMIEDIKPKNNFALELAETYKDYTANYDEEPELTKVPKKAREMRLNRDCLSLTNLFESDKNGR